MRPLIAALGGAVVGLGLLVVVAGVAGVSLARRRVVLHPRHRAHLRRFHQGVVGIGQPPPLSQGCRRVRRPEPFQLGVGSVGVTVSVDDQAGARRATSRSLPGSQRRPPPRPRTGRLLPPAHGRPKPQPHQGHLWRRPQVGLQGLGGSADRPVLPTPRPRRQRGRSARRHHHRGRPGRARRCPPTVTGTHPAESAQLLTPDQRLGGRGCPATSLHLSWPARLI